MYKKYLIVSIMCLVCMSKSMLFPHKWKVKTHEYLKKNKDRLSPNSLNHFGYCHYSQFGEDGIIEEIFRRLEITEGFFIEFGGTDGVWLSNTRNLYQKGWRGCFIEANTSSYKQLKKNYKDVPSVQCLNYFVSWNEEKENKLRFDTIKEKHFPEEEIDFLSIDIDGGDFYILKQLECRPKVICIENNLNWHPMFDKEIPESIAVQNIQQPLQVLINLAKEKGYRPVCLTINLFLVRDDLADAFNDTPTDSLTLWRDAFRALPDSHKIIERRKKNSFFMEYEGEELNALYPINLDF